MKKDKICCADCGEVEDEGFSPVGLAILFMLFVTLVRSLFVVIKYQWAVACDVPVSICWLVLVGYFVLSLIFGAIKDVVEGRRK